MGGEVGCLKTDVDDGSESVDCVSPKGAGVGMGVFMIMTSDNQRVSNMPTKMAKTAKTIQTYKQGICIFLFAFVMEDILKI